MPFESAAPCGAVRLDLARSPSLLRLRMLELSADLRTQRMPTDIADEVRRSISSLRRSIMANPSLSLADRDAKARTARDNGQRFYEC